MIIFDTFSGNSDFKLVSAIDCLRRRLIRFLITAFLQNFFEMVTPSSIVLDLLEDSIAIKALEDL
jgi:hypothetical protein